MFCCKAYHSKDFTLYTLTNYISLCFIVFSSNTKPFHTLWDSALYYGGKIKGKGIFLISRSVGW